MSFASILRRSATTAAPLALRLIGRSSNHHLPAVSAAILRRPAFSTVAEKSAMRMDLNLVNQLDEEIECADEPDPEAAEIPAGFPFKIEDKSGGQVVRLIREYEGETIEVEVYMPDLISGDDNDDKDDGDEESSPQSTLPLLVKISKDDGPSLEFSCNANADEVNIVGMSVKEPRNPDDMAYEGPDFSDLDENLQKAFHKYLNVRGITPSATNFLHEYMINKDAKEYKMWLENVKRFVKA